MLSLDLQRLAERRREQTVNADLSQRLSETPEQQAEARQSAEGLPQEAQPRKAGWLRTGGAEALSGEGGGGGGGGGEGGEEEGVGAGRFWGSGAKKQGSTDGAPLHAKEAGLRSRLRPSSRAFRRPLH
jgi:hypothetical protein